MSDILAYEVTLTDFATSEKLTGRFAFNTTVGAKTIKLLKPFTKYSINVNFLYSDNTEGSSIPSQQFRTRECSKY